VQLLCYAPNISNIKDKQSVGAPGHKAPGLKQLGRNPRTQQHGPAANLKGASLFIGANDDGPRLPRIREQYEEAPNQKL
jgi:hypothetical protein